MYNLKNCCYLVKTIEKREVQRENHENFIERFCHKALYRYQLIYTGYFLSFSCVADWLQGCVKKITLFRFKKSKKSAEMPDFGLA